MVLSTSRQKLWRAVAQLLRVVPMLMKVLLLHQIDVGTQGPRLLGDLRVLRWGRRRRRGRRRCSQPRCSQLRAPHPGVACGRRGSPALGGGGQQHWRAVAGAVVAAVAAAAAAVARGRARAPDPRPHPSRHPSRHPVELRPLPRPLLRRAAPRTCPCCTRLAAAGRPSAQARARGCASSSDRASCVSSAGALAPWRAVCPTVRGRI